MKRRKQSRIDVHGPLAFVELTGGLWACIDAEDVPKVAGVAWSALVKPNKTPYARAAQKRRRGETQHTVYMHRVLSHAPGLEVDHRNSNGLDNRQANLRVASRGDNSHNVGKNRDNTSGFKGVCWYKGRWLAQIRSFGVRHVLGLYPTPEEAHAAYVAAAHRLHGEFARTE